MASKTYEMLLILDSNHYSRDPGGVAKQIDQIITDAGGKVLVSRFWMEQKLAYPIDKHQKGSYWLTYFESEGDSLTKISRGLQLNEAVIRQLTIKLDSRLVEPVLANARGEMPVGQTPEGTGDGEPEQSAVGNEEESKEKEVVEA